MLMKLFVANVGVNMDDVKKRNIKSPIFKDATFEFIPIKESNKNTSFSELEYSELYSFNNLGKKLINYIPKKYHDYYVHNDPEFTSFTYGDIYTPRASNLKFMVKGDCIIFLARLFDYDNDSFTNKSNLYFIGYLIVEENSLFSSENMFLSNNKKLHKRIKLNAHYKRYYKGSKEQFRILIGDKDKSKRFKKGLKITPEVTGLLFNGNYNESNDGFISNKDGNLLKNKNGNFKKYSHFASITRSIQEHLNDSDKSEKKSMGKLFDLIDAKCF